MNSLHFQHRQKLLASSEPNKEVSQRAEGASLYCECIGPVWWHHQEMLSKPGKEHDTQEILKVGWVAGVTAHY